MSHKSCFFTGLFTLLILSVAMAADPPAVHPVTGEPLMIDCLRGTPNAIDGDLSDWNLQAMTPAVLDMAELITSDTADGASYWDGPEDFSGEFYLLWDDEKIYIAVVVKDDTISTNKSGVDIWNADLAEVFFSTLNAVSGHDEHYQFGFNPSNQKWMWDDMEGGASREPDFLQTASRETASGYICEVSIEYGGMLSLDWVAGNTIGFHPGLDDTDTGDREIQMTWTGLAAHDQSQGFAHMFLSTEPALAKEMSRSPNPANKADDVLRDIVLTWGPGLYAAQHNLYLGDTFEDVNTAAAPTAPGLDVNSFDPGRFEFGQTYYWRVDEVNGAPDKTVFRGDIWSFTVEPYSIQIPGDTVTATASSYSTEFSLPVNTINGSGLGDGDVHSTSSEDMWFTASVDLDPWIQYEFDDVKKLDIMKVWNSNSAAEMAIGWGAKDVQIETSTDGETWDALPDATQLSRAPGTPGYNTYDEIDFGGAAAKFVRLNIQNNWGGILMSYSLSEVQFFMIPAAARTPEPASGSVDVLPDSTVTWRAGREADQHTVYVSADVAEVADGSAPSVTVSANSLDLASLDLNLGETYYWRVDEVNNAEAISVWAGPVWNLSTPAALVVDDFESYNNISPDRPFQTWLDGFGYSADEYFPQGYAGNGTGAGIGHDIWSLTSPHYNGDIMETDSTLEGSSQSMPFYYTNSGGVSSETQRAFAVPQDWTQGGVQTLSIAFNGQAGNTGTLYAMINNAKISYTRDPTNIGQPGWQVWNIDLSSVSTNLQSVTELAIGVDGNGAEGMILIDDIKLYAAPGELITPVDPGTDSLVAEYRFEGNFNDSSGNGHNGTVVGFDGTQVVQDTARGQVLSLPGGSDQYVEIGAVGLSGNMPRTIACWAKAANTDIEDWTLIFGFTGQADASGGDGSHFNIGSLGGPGGIGAHCWGWEETMISDEAGLNWHHYAMTYDGTTIAYFLDGMPMDSDPGKSNEQDLATSGDRVHIGSRVTQVSSFPGNVDDAVIYDRALSAEEILWISGRTSPIDKPF